MTTNELIELLRKEDPEGNRHIRINGEMPWFAERKPGYWDGHYTYIENEKLVFSTENEKIDLRTMSEDDWIERVDGDWVDTVEFRIQANWEEGIRKRLRQSVAEFKEIRDKLFNEQFLEVMQKIRDGFKIKQENKWKYLFIKGLKKDQLTVGEVKVVRKSGFFKQNGDYWECILKED